MNIKVATIVLPLDLGEYHESFAGRKLLVWVNPPRELLEERIEILREGLSLFSKKKKPKAGIFQKYFQTRKGSAIERMFVWLNQMWSQHEDEECAWPVDDIRELYMADPAMYQWMTRRTVDMIDEHRAARKKK